MSRSRTGLAMGLLSAALIVQVIILIRGEESAGWAIAGIVLLAGAIASLFTSAQRA